MDEISVRVDESDPTNYIAHLSRLGHAGTEFIGNSPDEALGYAVRELWLAGDNNGVVTFKLTMKTE